MGAKVKDGYIKQTDGMKMSGGKGDKEPDRMVALEEHKGD